MWSGGVVVAGGKGNGKGVGVWRGTLDEEEGSRKRKSARDGDGRVARGTRDQ